MINRRRAELRSTGAELGLSDRECRDDHGMLALEEKMLASIKLYRTLFAQHREAFETQKAELREKAMTKHGVPDRPEDECTICMSTASIWIPQPCGVPSHRVCVECAPHCLRCPFCRAV